MLRSTSVQSVLVGGQRVPLAVKLEIKAIRVEFDILHQDRLVLGDVAAERDILRQANRHPGPCRRQDSCQSGHSRHNRQGRPGRLPACRSFLA